MATIKKAKKETELPQTPVDPVVQDNKIKMERVSKPAIDAGALELRFEKVALKDLNTIFVASTEQSFTIREHTYDGRDYFVVMFGPGHMFGVEKTFFNLIAQIK